MTMHINRCVCTNTTFAELVAIAKRDGLSLPQLAEQTGCTQGCGLCRPYVKRALETGQTEFHQLLPDVPDESAA